MDSNYWHQKWKSGDIRFHQTEYHPWLVQNIGRFRKGKILVPLCGKTLDLLYLYKQGFDVVGAELSSLACESFFKENHLLFKSELQEEFSVFTGDRIALWCGDFFQLPRSIWNSVTGIYDRAALVALPSPLRKQYAKSIVDNTSGEVEMLLITFEYQEGAITGPPYAVSQEEVYTLYDKTFDIREIHQEKNGSFVQGHPKLISTDIIERAYWLSKKG